MPVQHWGRYPINTWVDLRYSKHGLLEIWQVSVSTKVMMGIFPEWRTDISPCVFKSETYATSVPNLLWSPHSTWPTMCYILSNSFATWQWGVPCVQCAVLRVTVSVLSHVTRSIPCV